MRSKFINRIKQWKRRSSPYTKDKLIGSRFSIGEYTYGRPAVLEFQENTQLIIGKYCSIAPNVKIFLGGNHRVDWMTTYPFSDWPDEFPTAKGISGHPATKGDVVIGNDVWIGHSCIILSGVSIGDGAVLAAGSVVSKNIGSYEIWGGNPARFIRKRFSEDVIQRLIVIKWWDLSREKVLPLIPHLMSQNFEKFEEAIRDMQKA